MRSVGNFHEAARNSEQQRDQLLWKNGRERQTDIKEKAIVSFEGLMFRVNRLFLAARTDGTRFDRGEYSW